jgi:dihydroorotate dehydrogenase
VSAGVGFYRWLGPLLFRLDPETAHRLALTALKLGLVPVPKPLEDPILSLKVWGRAFPNPLGLAAGFDKSAQVPAALLKLGFGFVEVGSVTPKPQQGNPRPRLFRLTKDRAVINRMGFNNDGAAQAAERLRGRTGGIVGVNLGKNKESADAAADYAIGVRALAPLADYVVVNVSSPNTPGLRALQGRAPLAELLTKVRAALVETVPERTPPLLLKIAPDLAPADLTDIAEVAVSLPLDGLIATNTTIERPATLADPQRHEAGGLSGRPLFKPSTRVLAHMYKLTGGRLPLVGVGGVADGADAYAKIRAGASLVQLYTALVFEGPGLINRIKGELAGLLRRDGFKHVTDAVGADHR